MNCQGCKNLVVNNFTCRKYCLATGDFCQAERFSDIGSPIKPVNGECPGYVSSWGK